MWCSGSIVVCGTTDWGSNPHMGTKKQSLYKLISKLNLATVKLDFGRVCRMAEGAWLKGFHTFEGVAKKCQTQKALH